MQRVEECFVNLLCLCNPLGLTKIRILFGECHKKREWLNHSLLQLLVVGLVSQYNQFVIVEFSNATFDFN
jgi:hypothetical protein